MTSTDSVSTNGTGSDQALTGKSLSASLTVNDLQNSLRWYRDVMGFKVDQEHTRDGQVRAASLSAGDVRLVIGQDDGAKGWDRKKGEGFSLFITTSQDVDALAQSIESRGGTLQSPPTTMPWGPRVFRISDPDGFTFAIASQ